MLFLFYLRAFMQKLTLCALDFYGKLISIFKRSKSCLEGHLKTVKEGGLGIRLLEDFELVFRLKHVWNFFTNTGSLWNKYLS